MCVCGGGGGYAEKGKCGENMPRNQAWQITPTKPSVAKYGDDNRTKIFIVEKCDETNKLKRTNL